MSLNLEIELSDGTTRAERVDRNSGRIVGKRVSVNVVGKAQRAKDMVVVVVESLLFEGRPAGQNKSRKRVECVFFMLKDLVTSNRRRWQIVKQTFILAYLHSTSTKRPRFKLDFKFTTPVAKFLRPRSSCWTSTCEDTAKETGTNFKPPMHIRLYQVGLQLFCLCLIFVRK